MDKNAENTINELNKKIETLLAKKEAVIKKEKERKAKAQEKWRGVFLKEFMKDASSVLGENYEEQISAEELAVKLMPYLQEIAAERIPSPDDPKEGQEPIDSTEESAVFNAKTADQTPADGKGEKS